MINGVYIFLFLVFFIFIGCVFIYNRLVRNKNRMQEAWSIIDVLLKKRYDLVPNLVNSVKGYSMHEKHVLEEITHFRSEAMQAKNTMAKITSENGLTQALDRLLVTVEKYPNLRADAHFLVLQKQLTELEDELERARRYYNGTVRENNIAIESFPSNLVARLGHFQKGIFFSAKPSEKEIPEFSFSSNSNESQ